MENCNKQISQLTFGLKTKYNITLNKVNKTCEMEHIDRNRESTTIIKLYFKMLWLNQKMCTFYGFIKSTL